MPGTLYVVATPIGNLGDMTERAAETLRQVPVVAAEDTRETRKLTDHVGSRARLVSLHAHSEPHRVEEVVDLLVGGQDVALCSDAGTPAVSDPGPALVSQARARGIPVIPIPGPSAVAAALSVTGWPADQYLFLGFAPRKGKDRDAWLNRIRESTVSVVCFEAPGRTAELVQDLAEVCDPDRAVMYGREMTKKFEEYRLSSLGALAGTLHQETVRGEVTLVVAGAPAAEPAIDRGDAVRLAAALRQAGLERSRIAKVLAEVHGLSRNESYRMAIEEGQ
jgi:16S rRNA (cytidine1402-2'-O)-methyltransferase